jgi:hypothetical protein
MWMDVCHRLDYLQEIVVGLQDNLTRVENLCAGFFNDFYQPNQHHPRVLDSYQAAAQQYGCHPFTRLDGHTAAVVRWPDVPKPVVPGTIFTLSPPPPVPGLQGYVVDCSNHVLPFTAPVENQMLAHMLGFIPVL